MVASVNISTNPDEADVYVDDQFYGNSPATLKLKPGKHTIRVQTSGYKDWSRDMSTDAGAEVHLTAFWKKSNSQIWLVSIASGDASIRIQGTISSSVGEPWDESELIQTLTLAGSAANWL